MFIEQEVVAPTYEQMYQLFAIHHIVLEDGYWRYENNEAYICADRHINYHKYPGLCHGNNVLQEYEANVQSTLTNIVSAEDSRFDEDSDDYDYDACCRARIALYNEVMSYPHSDILPTNHTVCAHIINQEELDRIREASKCSAW